MKDLRENPAAVERIAREQLGLVRKSEVVFQFDKKYATLVAPRSAPGSSDRLAVAATS